MNMPAVSLGVLIILATDQILKTENVDQLPALACVHQSNTAKSRKPKPINRLGIVNPSEPSDLVGGSTLVLLIAPSTTRLLCRDERRPSER